LKKKQQKYFKKKKKIINILLKKKKKKKRKKERRIEITLKRKSQAGEKRKSSDRATINGRYVTGNVFKDLRSSIAFQICLEAAVYVDNIFCRVSLSASISA